MLLINICANGCICHALSAPMCLKDLLSSFISNYLLPFFHTSYVYAFVNRNLWINVWCSRPLEQSKFISHFMNNFVAFLVVSFSSFNSNKKKKMMRASVTIKWDLQLQVRDEWMLMFTHWAQLVSNLNDGFPIHAGPCKWKAEKVKKKKKGIGPWFEPPGSVGNSIWTNK